MLTLSISALAVRLDELRTIAPAEAQTILARTIQDLDNLTTGA